MECGLPLRIDPHCAARTWIPARPLGICRGCRSGLHGCSENEHRLRRWHKPFRVQMGAGHAQQRGSVSRTWRRHSLYQYQGARRNIPHQFHHQRRSRPPLPRSKRNLSAEVRYLHISNPWPATPNPGYNTIQFRLGFRPFRQYEEKNAIILGVSVQDETTHQKFCAKEGLGFRLLADTNHQVSSSYDSLMNLGVAKLSARHTFLIDPHSIVRKTYLNVNAEKHSAEVLADLSQLQQPPDVR